MLALANGNSADAYRTFRTHVIASNDASVGAMGKIEYDTAIEQFVVETLQPSIDWANGELAWLDAHPAASCYKTAYDVWRTSVAAARDAFQYLARGGSENYATAADKLGEAGAYLNQALQSVDEAAANCGVSP